MNRLEFQTAVDSSGFAQGIAKMEALAGMASNRISSAMARGGHGGHGGMASSIRESLVLLREGARGNYTRMAGSATLLTQYLGGLSLLFKSSADDALKLAAAERELTEKMAMAAVVANDKAMAVKAAALADGLDEEASNGCAAAMMREAAAARVDATLQNVKAEAAERAAQIASASATTTITAFGWIAIGAAALAVPLYMLWKHFSNLAKVEHEYAEASDATKKKFTDEAEAADRDAKAHEDFNKWLEKELENRRSLHDITEERIEQLRKEADAQRQLAQAKGASAAEINAMEVEQLKTEAALIQSAKDRAQVDLDASVARAKAANAAFTENPSMATPDGNVDLTSAERHKKATGDVVDKINDSIDARLSVQILERMKKSGAKTVDPEKYTAVENMDLAVSPVELLIMRGLKGMDINAAIGKARSQEGNRGKSEFGATLDEATADYSKNSQYVEQLKSAQKKLAEELDASKDDEKAKREAVTDYTRRLNEIQTDLGIKSGVGKQTAAFEDIKKNHFGGGGADSMVKVGNFLGSARSGIENVSREHVRIAKESLGHLKSIDGKMSHGSGGSFGI